MRLKIIGITYLLLFSFLSLQAQIFEYIGMENGLSSRRVISIRQDAQDYIWILTHKGIDRYNGKQFKHYSIIKDDGAVNFFPNINFLRTDKNRNIWEIGRDGFVYLYDAAKDSFLLKFDLKATFPDIRRAPITYSYMDRYCNIWFCGNNQQYIYNGLTGKSYAVSGSIPGIINCITQGEGNRYYFACGPYVYEAQLSGNSLKNIRKTDISQPHLIDYIYYHTPTRQLIVNTLLDRLFLYHIDTHEVTYMGTALRDIGINTIIPDRNNDKILLIATDGDGVYKLDTEKLKLLPFLQEDTVNPNRMNGSVIKDIYMDQAGRIWNVVYPIGITVYSEKYPQYQWLKHSANNPNSLVDDCINCIMTDSDGDQWYATNNGVCYYDKDRRKWVNIPTRNIPGSDSENNIFLALCEITPGRILAGGYMSGYYDFNKKTGKATFYNQKELENVDGPDKYIRSIYLDKEKVIWIGGFYRLKSFDIQTRKVTEYNLGYPITHISQRDSNSLWIGTSNGVYVFNKQQGKIDPFESKFDIGGINDIYTDKQTDKSYFCTNGKGLYVMDNRTHKMIRYYTRNSGLLSDNIFSIVPNREGNLFLGTENGLSFYDLKTQKFVNWTREQGLMAASFNPNTAVHTGGQLIFGSNEGVIILPDSMRIPSEFQSHMVFTDLNIMYHEVHPGEKDSPLTQPLDKTQEIRLDYKENTFSLNVSSINFDNPSNILYSWELEGFYDGWTQPSPNAQIRYTNLSPGSYTLHVRAILQDNGNVLEERTIRIVVGRPYWMSIWAFLVYALATVGIIYAIIRYQLANRDRRASKEKINFFIHTAHDIRTPLTLIKAPLAEIQKNEQLSKQGENNLKLAIQSSETLSELANNLMNFQKEEFYSSTVTVSQYELNGYLQEYLQQFKDYAAQKNISVEYRNGSGGQKVWIDRNKMDTILCNLLTNALKYTPQGGSITIETNMGKNSWIIKITDTGIGIPKEDQEKMFKKLFRGKNATDQLIAGSGIGMLLTYRLIQNHQGKISFNSIENIGTTFLLTFPIRNPHYQYRNDEESIHSAGSDNILKKDDTDSVDIAIDYKESNTSKENAPLILVVEDNTNLRHFLMNNLAGTYRVEEAENGQEAIEAVKKQQPDLIISDILMPLMTGEEMCRHLKDDLETSHIPIILLTALGDKKNILKGLESKADMYIVKPFDLMILKANIKNILENREQMQKKFQQIQHPAQLEEISLPTSLDDEFILKVTELIKDGLTKDLTVDTLCAQVNMSRTSFYNKLKALTGIAPADFIRNIRMQEAARLLKSKRYNVAEVSDMTGFADPKYFTDIFKKYYGMPPSVYMKQQN